MTFMYKECEDKKNDTRAMTTMKNKVFIGLLLENCCLVGEMNFWWWWEGWGGGGRKFNARRILPGGGISKF